MPRDHQFLVGRNHPYRYTACICRDSGSVARIRCGVELDTKPPGCLADFPPDFSGGLSDTRGKYESIDAPQHRSQCAYFLCSLVDEVVYRQPCLRLAAAKKIAHVVADSRDA